MIKQTYCKNCGKEIQEDDIFCGECGTRVKNVIESEEISLQKVDENEDNVEDFASKKIVKGKRVFIMIFFVLLILLLVVGGYKWIENLKEGDRGVFGGKRQYFISSECALTEDGDVIYEIEYKYDSNGNEIGRVAYDENGDEDENYLKYAYDRQWEILEEYWEIDVDDEEQATLHFKQHPDYIFTYDPKGKLIKWDFLKENELGIYVIEYSYTSIIINEKESNSTDEGKKDSSEEDNISLEDKIINGYGNIIVSGEECKAVWGESGALVWKYVEATFNERAYFASAFAIDEHSTSFSMSSPLPDGWDAMRITNWYKWYGLEEFTPYHIGDDMFILEGSYYGEYFCYYINAINSITYREGDLSPDGEDVFNRYSNFNDGYMIGGMECYDGTRLISVDKNWNFTYSGIYASDYCAGQYSDDVFYYDGVFYDIEFDEVLDISNKEWGRVYTKTNVYAPFFKDGICRLITYKNGKYWIFSIDKKGEIVSEVEEFDLNLLNY